MINWLEKMFHLKKNGTSVRVEFRAAVVTFLAMSYILFLNPQILSEAGIPKNAAFFATIMSASFASIIMGFRANLPIVLAPGMGLNAFLTFGVVKGLGYSWQQALAAIFVSGIIFIIIGATGLRKTIIQAIPDVLKDAVAVGIGFFIAFVGLKNAGIIVAHDATIVGLGNLNQPSTIITIIMLFLTIVLLIKKVKSAIFIGMFVGIILNLITGVSQFNFSPQVFNVEMFSAVGAFFPALKSGLLTPSFYGVVLAFLFVDFFDTAGTLIAITSRLGLPINKEGMVDGMSDALIVDASATTFGAMIGTSSVTAFSESLAGVAAGGKTGLMAIFTGLFFLLSIVIAPFLQIVHVNVTAPALIIVGCMMTQSFANIDLRKLPNAIITFLTVIITVLTYSIAKGIAFGVITYTIIKIAEGKYKEIHWIMYILTCLFIINFLFGFGV